jgi:hypothetical protein
LTQHTYQKPRDPDDAEDFLGVTPPPTGKGYLPGKRSSDHPASPPYPYRARYECSPPPTNRTDTASAGQKNGLAVRQTVLRKKRIPTYSKSLRDRTCQKGDLDVKRFVSSQDGLSQDGLSQDGLSQDGHSQDGLSQDGHSPDGQKM